MRYSGMISLRTIIPIPAAFLVCLASAAMAEVYPAKPIRIEVGFTAGGVTDVLARALAQRLGEKFKASIVVENKPGAAGLLANTAVAKAAPDGYTLLVASGSSITSLPHMQAKMPYDSLKDLAPVSQIAQFSFVLAAHPSVPAKNARELIALARAKPGFLTAGSSGIGTAFHLSLELFNTMAKVSILHVPYKGGAAVLPDLASGRIDLLFYSLGTLQPLIQAKRLNAIAVTDLKRNPQLPDVPTVDESGIKGYRMVGWQGVFTTGGAPPAIVAQLNSAIAEIVASSQTKKLWEEQGLEVAKTTPEEFSAIVHDEFARYRKLIQRLDVKHSSEGH